MNIEANIVANDVHLWQHSSIPSQKVIVMPNFESTSTHVAKKSTNVSLPEDLLVEAKSLRINVSQAAEFGVARAVADKRAEIWLKENYEAIESSNAYVEKHGLPLEKYRMF